MCIGTLGLVCTRKDTHSLQLMAYRHQSQFSLIRVASGRVLGVGRLCVCFVSTGWECGGCNPWPPPSVPLLAWEAASGGSHTRGHRAQTAAGLPVSSRYSGPVCGQSEPDPHKLSDRHQAWGGRRGRRLHLFHWYVCARVCLSHKSMTSN